VNEWYTQAEAEAWADGIGAALAAYWKGADDAPTDTTRAELLGYANPEPHAADILDGDNPKRAVPLWDAAISLLRERGVIGEYTEPSGPWPWREPGFMP